MAMSGPGRDGRGDVVPRWIANLQQQKQPPPKYSCRPFKRTEVTGRPPKNVASIPNPPGYVVVHGQVQKVVYTVVRLSLIQENGHARGRRCY